MKRTARLAAVCSLVTACAPPPPQPAAPSIDVACASPPESVAEPVVVTVPTSPDPRADAFGPIDVHPSELTRADTPPILQAGTAPATLPPSKGAGLKRKRAKILSNGNLGIGSVEVDTPGLARLQLGKVRIYGGADRRQFLYCEDDIERWRATGHPTTKLKPKPQSPAFPGMGPAPPFHPKTKFQGITPARWEVLTRGDDGKLLLTVTDAWFDHHTCKASVQRVTEITPQPLLDGLVYAFRGNCVDCRYPDIVTFIVPSMLVSSSRHHYLSRGDFTIARFPVKGRVSARLVGYSRGQRLKTWAGFMDQSDDFDASQRLLISTEVGWDHRTPGHRVSAFAAQSR